MRVFVAGHKGLLGSALVRQLQCKPDVTVLTRDRAEVDLRDARAVDSFFTDDRPDAVLLAAAKVGGIQANASEPWDFLFENLQIEASVLGAALVHRTRRVVFFGSSCIYPKLAPQPIQESALLTGVLEETNEPYAIAKIAGLKLVEAAHRQYGMQWVSLMPTNLYGPGDNFDLERSHVLPALIRRFHEAKEHGASNVTLWGDGTPFREFLHVDDVARAGVAAVYNDLVGLYNVGFGSDISIRDLAELVARIVGFTGTIEWDTSRPNGTPKKLLDSSKIQATGWAPEIPLEEGIRSTYEWFLTHRSGR